MAIPQFEYSDTDQGFVCIEATTGIYGNRCDKKDDAQFSCEESLSNRYEDLCSKDPESLSSGDKSQLELLQHWVSTGHIS